MTMDDVIIFLPLLAAVFLFAAYLCRDQMWLRALSVFGFLVFAIYFVMLADVPLWPAVLAAALIVAVNIFMMAKVVNDNRMFKLSAEEMLLYSKLPGLMPAEFKLLLNDAVWHETKVPQRLTVLGRMPDALHFILEGKAEVERDGKRFDIGPDCFVGELAFLRGNPATATVHARPGALYVSWPQAELRALMKSNDGVNRAMAALLSGDLAQKIARTPMLTSKV